MRHKKALLALVVLASVGLGIPPALAAAPTVTSFDPTSGIVGASIVISGDGFDTATAVSFNGTAALFTIDSALQITTTVPHGATTGPISVDNPDGTGTSLTDFTVLPTPTPPSIGSFTPHQGVVGRSVTIFGTNFTDVTEVEFDGTPADFKVVNDTEITTSVPPGATTGPITVTNLDGSDSTGAPFEVIRRPHISDFSPKKGPVGTLVTIVGNNQLQWVTRVWFGTEPAKFSVITNSKLRAKVPSGFKDAKIKVKNPAGQDTSSGEFNQRRIKIDTRVTFQLSKHLRAAGAVNAEGGTRVCEARRVVLIQRLVDGTWRTIKRIRSGAGGGFNTSVPDTAGTYRAVAPRKATLRIECLTDPSPTDKHEHASGGGGGGGGGGGDCTPGYSPCLPLGPSDYDCYGGSGNGPAYTSPGVTYRVTGSDPYDLDSDGDGYGCEPSG